ncbi:phytoene desaturase family protein [Sulfuriroseicoccus oceanibius]|uniref:Phytoene desaturase n=1 Tax=Sulfuriroseicoccus oceanibius TaxID=2707525 RepID=A0A6B3L3H0_9BACT|nr:phytoene desaturase family protein [Sulfuriroseicoccus oceanibius]QQL46049.1 phytoene desaturase [Sulfuriroseicoccus oceanibius]
MKRTTVSVIGAGLGGLSAAISLKAAGYDVAVYEKNARIGGKLNLLEKDEYTFDLGPSIFTLPQFFRDLFERAGRNMDDYVQLEKVTPHWRNFFEDGFVFDLYEEDERMRQEFTSKLNGSGEKAWQEYQRFLEYARQQYDIVDEGYFRHGLDNLWEFLRYYGLRRLGKEIDYKRSMAESIADYFSDPRMRSIFEYFIKYVGSSALDAPGYMNLMPVIQVDYGLWYVKGGMYALAEGLGKLMEEMEIPVHLNADVAKINREGKTVTGLTLVDGTVVSSDLVVSNMEVVPTYDRLLGESPRFLKRLEKFAPACSGIVIHLGTNKEFPQLAHHNFFFSNNQHKHFKTVFHDGRLPEDPTLYVVAPTRTDPSKAPEGCDNIKILPHIPPIDPENPVSHAEYLALRDRVIDKMERSGITGLRDSVVTEDFLTPVDIEQMYRSNRGSIYGVVSDWKKNHGFKAPKTSRKYRNLYFCGGSTNPGGGMPMVVLSGQKVADRIIAKHPASC